MAKLLYLDQKHGDADDRAHHAAIAEGVVGEHCRLGGEAIETLRPHSPKDVCAVCPVPAAMREDCGGRPSKEKPADAKKVLDEDERVTVTRSQTAEAYRVRHERHGAVIARLFLQQQGTKT